jgi:hypothetical protein
MDQREELGTAYSLWLHGIPLLLGGTGIRNPAAAYAFPGASAERGAPLKPETGAGEGEGEGEGESADDAADAVPAAGGAAAVADG